MNTTKAKLAALLLLSCTAFCGCAAEPAASSEPEVTAAGTSAAPDAEPALTTEYLLDIDLTFPDSKQSNMVYMFFVKQDGTVLTTQCSTDSEPDFFRKKALLDPAVFDLADPLQEIGRLPEDETAKFASEVAAIDPESEREVRDDETPAPDVEETYHLTYGFCLPEQTKQFVALSRGEQKGISIRSKDAHAAAAISLIEDAPLFQQWLQEHLSANPES